LEPVRIRDIFSAYYFADLKIDAIFASAF